MEKNEIDRTLELAKKFLKNNREDHLPPRLKGEFLVTESGIVLPLDDIGKGELEK